MKLQNKKTGDIGVLNVSNNKYYVIAYGLPLCGNSVLGEYDTLDALMQEWEDYEEPKEWSTISMFDRNFVIKINEDTCAWTDEDKERYVELGFKFETEEEAEKAVEKLKAWKRLRNKGFRIKSYDFDYLLYAHKDGTPVVKVICYFDRETEEDKKYLDLLFGGEK